MNNRQRGSEKLLAGCAGLQMLSPEELEQVRGAGLLSSPMGVMRLQDWPFFPLGVPALHTFQSELAALKQVDGAA